MVADGSYITANVSRESLVEMEIEVEQSMQSYLDCPDEELSATGIQKAAGKNCEETSHY